MRQYIRSMPVMRWAAAVALAAGATAAHAGYFVSTVANTGRGYDRGCAATYNDRAIGRVGAAFILNDGSQAPCPTMPFNGQTVTVSGTTDTSGRLNASHDASSVVSLPDSAYATAAADLRTAQVHLSSSAANFSEASASAELNDTLHFTVAGASAATVTLIPVSFAFDGRIVTTVDYAHAGAELNYSFSFGNAAAYEFGDYGAAYYGGAYNSPTFAYAGPAIVSGWVSSSFASYVGGDTRFSGLYAITGATADIPIDFVLGLRTSNIGLDFANTGTIGVGHVAGVSFTSDSGVFLAGAAGAVPEPASWLLLVAGFGAVGLAGRGRRATTVAA